jgi:hypothetical protein
MAAAPVWQCWANEDDAVNDDGANAIATITRVHDADA